MILRKRWGCATAALILAACSPALNWREVRAVDGDAVAMFPCKPERRVRDVALAGTRVQMHLASCTVRDVTYALSHATVAEPARVGPALAELRDAAAANVGGRPTVLGPFTVRGMTPNPLAEKMDVAGRGADGEPIQLRAGFFAKGMQVYQATVAGAALDPAAAETFFTGLSLPP